MKSITAKKIVIVAVLSAIALIMFMVENLFPPVFVPGAKMGLSNIVILITIIMFGELEGIFVLLVKCILGSLFSGNPAAILYSLPAGLVAVFIEIILFRYVFPKISVVAISVCGAIVNLVIQNLIHAMISGAWEMFTFLPYLALIGTISGLIVGIASHLLIKYIPDKFLTDLNGIVREYYYEEEN